MIDKFFTSRFSNKRMNWYDEASTLEKVSNFKAHKQQISIERSQELGMVFSKSFVLWISKQADILEGDVLKEWGSGKKYNVRAVKDLLVGDNKHKQVYIQLVEDYE